MQLRTRALRAGDFPRCWPLVSNQFAYSPEMVKILPGAWKHLLETKAIVSAVLEDLDRPEDDQVMAFGASVFVRHSWMKEAKQQPAPFLPARVITGYRDPHSPILTRPQIARANAGAGLDLLVIHHAWRKTGVTVAEELTVQQALVNSYFEVHRGYRLRETLNEVYGEVELNWSLSGGNHELVRSYAPYYDAKRLPPPALVPYLVRTSRDRAAETLATVTSQMFLFTPPRIGYSAKQQDLLELALAAKNDREAADLLGITEDAVARRWRGIYRRSEEDAELRERLRAAEGGLKGPSTRRRYLLLEILRQRPEELRPWHGPTARRDRPRT